MWTLALLAAAIAHNQQPRTMPTRTGAASTAMMIGLGPRELATAGASETEAAAMLSRLAEAEELRAQFHAANAQCANTARTLREVRARYRASPHSSQATASLAAAAAAHTSARSERDAIQASLADLAVAALPAERQAPVRPQARSGTQQHARPSAQAVRQIMQVFTSVP